MAQPLTLGGGEAPSRGEGRGLFGLCPDFGMTMH